MDGKTELTPPAGDELMAERKFPVLVGNRTPIAQSGVRVFTELTRIINSMRYILGVIVSSPREVTGE
jgi:hypothetical protein